GRDPMGPVRGREGVLPARPRRDLDRADRAAARRAALLIAAAAAVLAGCGSPRPFVEDARRRDAAGTLPRAPHPSHGPPLGPAHLAFLDPRVGFAASTGGAYYFEKVGYQAPREPGEVAVTRDGGATWRTLWRGSGVVFDAVAADRRHVYAWG